MRIEIRAILLIIYICVVFKTFGQTETKPKTEFYARLVNESRYYGHRGTGDSVTNDPLVLYSEAEQTITNITDEQGGK